jgi:hypothetical protein
MARDSVRDVLRQFHTLYALGAVGGLSDDDLLRRLLLPPGHDFALRLWDLSGVPEIKSGALPEKP